MTKKQEETRVIEPLITLSEASNECGLGTAALRKRCIAGECGRKRGGIWFLTPKEIKAISDEGYRPAGRPRKSER